MTTTGLSVISLMVVAFAIMIMIARHSEKKAFNNGYCRYCETRLRHFDNDSQGGRGYVCDKCGRNVWVSYKVDKCFRV